MTEENGPGTGTEGGGGGGAFDFKKFVDDSKNVLLAPKDYFTGMAKEGGLVEPLIKALLYGAISGLITMLWSIIGIGAVGGMFGAAAGTGIGIMAFVMAIVGALIGLFLGGVLILIVSAICGGSTDFEANVRVAASMLVLSPISSLFGVLTGIHFSLGAIASLVVSVYGIYLLYNAVINALGGKPETAKIVSIVLAVIPVLMLVSTLICARAVTTTSDKWLKQSEKMMKQVETDNTEAMKRLDALRKQMEEAAKKSKE